MLRLLKLALGLAAGVILTEILCRVLEAPDPIRLLFLWCVGMCGAAYVDFGVLEDYKEEPRSSAYIDLTQYQPSPAFAQARALVDFATAYHYDLARIRPMAKIHNVVLTPHELRLLAKSSPFSFAQLAEIFGEAGSGS